jgi:hypothetical protein
MPGKMKTVILIPTYWTREKEKGVKWSDVPHDHPTPIDETGTLKRAVLSLDGLDDRDFTLIVTAAASSESSKEMVDKRVKEILKRCCPRDIDAYLFTHPHLDLLEGLFKDNGGTEFLRLVDIHGYSNMRNLSLIIAQILDADILVSIDDDEYINDPEFLRKAKENIGKKVDGTVVEGVTGYYVDPSGDYHVDSNSGEWTKYWNKMDAMNRAFEMFISGGPRLKRASWALGGCMVHGRNLMEKIPYDPLIQRGEDVDYLINARMFGLDLFMDNELRIVHAPPAKPHPIWRRLMIDSFRFVYERQKLLSQKETVVRAEDLDPYPGEFLKSDLDEKIKNASKALSEEYLKDGDEEAAEIALEIPRMSSHNVALNPYTHLLELKDTWERLTLFIRDSGLKGHDELFWEI